MAETGAIDKSAYNILLSIIKDQKDEWFMNMKRYDVGDFDFFS